jgi:hypothetical protein
MRETFKIRETVTGIESKEPTIFGKENFVHRRRVWKWVDTMASNRLSPEPRSVAAPDRANIQQSLAQQLELNCLLAWLFVATDHIEYQP